MNHMKSIPAFLAALVVLAVFTMATSAPVQAQTQKVLVDMNIPEYDVVYLADIVDVTTKEIKATVPNISWTLTVEGVPQRVELVMRVKAYLQMKGEAMELLVDGVTRPFFVNGTRIITSQDVSKESRSEIQMLNHTENKPLRDRLEKYVEKFPTAPVGNYRIDVLIYKRPLTGAITTPADADRFTPIGTGSKTLSVRNASPEEVAVTLESPLDRDLVFTTFPTFIWSSENETGATAIHIYEMLPIHRSPQEAVNGIPHLVKRWDPAKGDRVPKSFTYPTNAPRMLETGKRYVWFVTKTVKTNRGDVERQSPIYRFRVTATDDPIMRILEQWANSQGGDLPAVVQSLVNMGWTPSGGLLLDGRRISADELKLLVEKLVRDNRVINMSIESR